MNAVSYSRLNSTGSICSRVPEVPNGFVLRFGSRVRTRNSDRTKPLEPLEPMERLEPWEASGLINGSISRAYTRRDRKRRRPASWGRSPSTAAPPSRIATSKSVTSSKSAVRWGAQHVSGWWDPRAGHAVGRLVAPRAVDTGLPERARDLQYPSWLLREHVHTDRGSGARGNAAVLLSGAAGVSSEVK